MTLNDFFQSLRQYTESIKLACKNASLSRPYIYGIEVLVPANGTNEGVIPISTEGAFISQSLSIAFDFDGSNLPQVSFKAFDTSNGDRALTNTWIPLDLIASVGKNGNQLLALFPFEHYFKEGADLRLEFKNDGAIESNVKFALIGKQTRI